MEIVETTTKDILATIPLEDGMVICIKGPSQQFILQRLVPTSNSEKSTDLVEWVLREDKLKCSLAFEKKRGRVQVRSLNVCLERYKAELLYGSFVEKKKTFVYSELLREFWNELQELCKSEERVELGCWCIDEPNTPANQLKYTTPSCHTQVVLETIRDEFEVKIPDNIFIINVKKDSLQKRNITPTEWVANERNFYLGYLMPFLPYKNHPLRNIYKVCPYKSTGKRKQSEKKPNAIQTKITKFNTKQ